MDQPVLLQQGLEALLSKIGYYKAKDAKYDEWQDQDLCSILNQLDSREFEPLFSEFEGMVEEIKDFDPSFEIEAKVFSIGAPAREVVTDEYGQQYVSYFYESDHLEELEEAIISTMAYLKGKEN